MSEPASLIEELRALADAATPGKWSADCYPLASERPWYGMACGISAFDDDEWLPRTKANAKFIARSRSAIPELCDALESALRERDEAVELLRCVLPDVAAAQEHVPVGRLALLAMDADAIRTFLSALGDSHD